MLPICLDLQILDKAYLVPIMNTPDKTGESVAVAINTQVSVCPETKKKKI